MVLLVRRRFPSRLHLPSCSLAGWLRLPFTKRSRRKNRLLARLSVCLIVRNEEHNLPRALESVAAFADAYADQTEKDYETLKGAVQSGRIAADGAS